MLPLNEWQNRLKDGGLKEPLERLYGDGDGAEAAAARYEKALSSFEERFGQREAALLSAPGRCELGGNHTDHQQGLVLAAAIDLDIVAVAGKREDGCIHILSQTGQEVRFLEIDGRDLFPREREIHTSEALIRGVAAGFSRRGLTAGGFDAYLTSNIPWGAGLSSSAAFEVLTGGILNALYNENTVSRMELAAIGLLAENEFFGKPSGMMDQAACALGGVLKADFGDPEKPAITSLPFPPLKDCRLLLVNPGGSHEDLTEEYATIPRDMEAVAALFQKDCLRQVDPETFYSRLGQLRGQVRDLALLRAIHFFQEEARVEAQAAALTKGDLETFLRLTRESGLSSFTLLQNCCPSANPDERSLSLSLGISEMVLKNSGAVRVHGGGFAGTIQAYVPRALEREYVEAMETVFGSGCCYPAAFRREGIYVFEKGTPLRAETASDHQ